MANNKKTCFSSGITGHMTHIEKSLFRTIFPISPNGSTKRTDCSRTIVHNHISLTSTDTPLSHINKNSNDSDQRYDIRRKVGVRKRRLLRPTTPECMLPSQARAGKIVPSNDSANMGKNTPGMHLLNAQSPSAQN